MSTATDSLSRDLLVAPKDDGRENLMEQLLAEGYPKKAFIPPEQVQAWPARLRQEDYYVVDPCIPMSVLGCGVMRLKSAIKLETSLDEGILGVGKKNVMPPTEDDDDAASSVAGNSEVPSVKSNRPPDAATVKASRILDREKSEPEIEQHSDITFEVECVLFGLQVLAWLHADDLGHPPSTHPSSPIMLHRTCTHRVD